jgi:hypothetical protein
MTRRHAEREHDRLIIGDLVWAYNAPCLAETVITDVSVDFTWVDQHGVATTAPLGYRTDPVRFSTDERPFFSRSSLFRRPAERDELIAAIKSNVSAAQDQLADLAAYD